MSSEQIKAQREDTAWMVIDKDQKVIMFDMDKAKKAAKDPNPSISGTASIVIQLIEACASTLPHVADKTKILNLKIDKRS